MPSLQSAHEIIPAPLSTRSARNVIHLLGWPFAWQIAGDGARLPLEGRFNSGVIAEAQDFQRIQEETVQAVDGCAGHWRKAGSEGMVGGDGLAQQVLTTGAYAIVLWISAQLSQEDDLPGCGLILTVTGDPPAFLTLGAQNARYWPISHDGFFGLEDFGVVFRLVQQLAQGKVAHAGVIEVVFEQPGEGGAVQHLRVIGGAGEIFMAVEGRLLWPLRRSRYR